MANSQFTYGQLSAIRDDIQYQQHASPAFWYFNKEKIERFFQQHGPAIKIYDSRQTQLIQELVQHDKDGVPCTMKNEAGALVYVFETEEKEKEYISRLQKLGAQKALTLLN